MAVKSTREESRARPGIRIISRRSYRGRQIFETEDSGLGLEAFEGSLRCFSCSVSVYLTASLRKRDRAGMVRERWCSCWWYGSRSQGLGRRTFLFRRRQAFSCVPFRRCVPQNRGEKGPNRAFDEWQHLLYFVPFCVFVSASARPGVWWGIKSPKGCTTASR